MHVAVTLECLERLLPALHVFSDELGKKKSEFWDIIKIGRTHT